MSNQAAWITTRKGFPLEVKEAPMPQPEANEVVVRNHAVAMNPLEWKIQAHDAEASFVQSYPFILGTDGAGVVHSVGSGVTAFKPGDRVIVHYSGLFSGKAGGNAFQLYATANEGMMAHLPDDKSFVQGTVLPLAISTAATGLYQSAEKKSGLGLRPLPSTNPTAQNKTVLIWGASGSVGSAAVQLACASGFDVVATASQSNFHFVRSLGATAVFDYNRSDVISNVVEVLNGKSLAGVYDAVSTDETARQCLQIAQRVNSPNSNKAVVLVIPNLEPPEVEGVKVAKTFAGTILSDEVGPAIWGKYVGDALKLGQLKCKPDPLVIGQGLENIQAGLTKLQGGVSASKVVVELP